MRTRIIKAWKYRLVIRVFLFALFFTTEGATAQQNFYFKDLLPASFHQGRRAALRKAMPPKTCAVIFANPVRNRSNNVDFQYSQDPDFYYLTGLTEPHSVLFLFSDPINWEGRSITELIFIQDKNPADELWNGKIAGANYVRDSLGLSAVAFNYEFSKRQPDMSGMDQVWVKWPKDIGHGTGRKNTLHWLVGQYKETLMGLDEKVKTSPLSAAMADLRELKLEPELVLMQKAIDMTVDGLAEAIRSVRPGITEYQAQAVVEFYFKHRGSEYPGYPSISGGGENTCVLHHTVNRKQLSDGDLLLMDMGAEYHGYTADVTRTVPVNGKFSPEQTVLYELVLEAQLAGIAACRKNNAFHEPNRAAQQVIAQGLVKLGIIKDVSDYSQYFPHGTSHYLGLEVHDAGNFGPLQPSTVITVEPGIYIPEGSPCDKKWWNIGIRIEDDILITDNEPVVMSEKLPKTISELEKLITETSLFEEVK
jgi:Xaa-Pro aminopeptidase